MNYVYRNSASVLHILHLIRADIPPYFRSTRLTAFRDTAHRLSHKPCEGSAKILPKAFLHQKVKTASLIVVSDSLRRIICFELLYLTALMHSYVKASQRIHKRVDSVMH